MKSRVSIIEDNARDARFCRELIDRTADFVVVSQHATGSDAIAHIHSHAPDLVLMDLKLPGCKGHELLPVLRQQLTNAQFVIVTVYDDEEDLFKSLQAGASAYVLKRDITTELIPTLHEVVQGHSRITGAVARMILDSFQTQPEPKNPLLELSAREVEVLEQIARGLAYKEIASHLKISVNTVRAHLRRIYEKLHVRSATEAAVVFTRFKGK